MHATTNYETAYEKLYKELDEDEYVNQLMVSIKPGYKKGDSATRNDKETQTDLVLCEMDDESISKVIKNVLFDGEDDDGLEFNEIYNSEDDEYASISSDNVKEYINLEDGKKMLHKKKFGIKSDNLTEEIFLIIYDDNGEFKRLPLGRGYVDEVQIEVKPKWGDELEILISDSREILYPSPSIVPLGGLKVSDKKKLRFTSDYKYIEFDFAADLESSSSDSINTKKRTTTPKRTAKKANINKSDEASSISSSSSSSLETKSQIKVDKHDQTEFSSLINGKEYKKQMKKAVGKESEEMFSSQDELKKTKSTKNKKETASDVEKDLNGKKIKSKEKSRFKKSTEPPTIKKKNLETSTDPTEIFKVDVTDKKEEPEKSDDKVQTRLVDTTISEYKEKIVADKEDKVKKLLKPVEVSEVDKTETKGDKDVKDFQKVKFAPIVQHISDTPSSDSDKSKIKDKTNLSHMDKSIHDSKVKAEPESNEKERFEMSDDGFKSVHIFEKEPLGKVITSEAISVKSLPMMDQKTQQTSESVFPDLIDTPGGRRSSVLDTLEKVEKEMKPLKTKLAEIQRQMWEIDGTYPVRNIKTQERTSGTPHSSMFTKTSDYTVKPLCKCPSGECHPTSLITCRKLPQDRPLKAPTSLSRRDTSRFPTASELAERLILNPRKSSAFPAKSNAIWSEPEDESGRNSSDIRKTIIDRSSDEKK